MTPKHLKKSIAAFFLTVIPYCIFAQSYTISGYVQDAETGENLIGATVYEQFSQKGTVTNNYGFFSITLRSDSVELSASFIGYKTEIHATALNQNLHYDFKLPSGSELEEVVVTDKKPIEQLNQMSKINLSISQIEAVPVILGEADILKTIQLLPGIQAGSEGSSGIYVRGGGPDQNLILLDGVPIYNVSHLFGFFSVFNSDAIKNIDVTKGGFPARYGGRLSSVIDISMKEGNNQEFHGEGSIGLISSKLTLEGPIMKGKTSFMLSGRRTYADVLARPFIKTETSDGSYFFYDINAKINHIFSRKDRIYLSLYNGHDKGFSWTKSVKENEDNGQITINTEDDNLKWGNTIAAFRWNHLFGSKLFSNLTATYSRYNFNASIDRERESRGPEGDTSTYEFIEYSSGIKDYSIRFDVDYLPHPKHNIKSGASIIFHEFTPGVIGYTGTDSDSTLGSKSIHSVEYSAYLEDDFQLSKSFGINLGVHHSAFKVNGKNYSSIQPRISARQLIGPYAVKASYSHMTQFVHLLTNAGIGLPTDLWVPATEGVAPQRAWQAALGVARTFRLFELSVEAYYKDMDNLIAYKEGASFMDIGGEDWQDKVTTGRGESYGLELLARKNTGRLTGWVGYTLSKTNRTFEEHNFGKTYPYRYDRRHDVSMVGTYAFSKRFSLSGTWVYGTGNAITLPVATFSRNQSETELSDPKKRRVIQYGETNGYRMRAYHRLDLGVQWTKAKRWGSRTIAVGAYNVYNRRNPFFIDEKEKSDGTRGYVQVSLFPFIPYFKYGFKF